VSGVKRLALDAVFHELDAAEAVDRRVLTALGLPVDLAESHQLDAVRIQFDPEFAAAMRSSSKPADF